MDVRPGNEEALEVAISDGGEAKPALSPYSADWSLQSTRAQLTLAAMIVMCYVLYPWCTTLPVYI